MTRSHCAELGVCQSREPRCGACRHAYAPGVIEGYRPPRTFGHRLARVGAWLAPVCAAVGLAAGFAVQKGWL